MNMIEFAGKLDDALSSVLIQVLIGLEERRKDKPATFEVAVQEILAALQEGSCNNYRPTNPEVWAIIADPIRVHLDYDLERTYILAQLFGHITGRLADHFESLYGLKMVEALVS